MDEGQLSKYIDTLKYTPELGPPTLIQFLALLGVVLCLIVIGHFIKSIWARSNEMVPIPVALLMALAMFITYFVVASMLFQRSPEGQRTNMLMWSIFALALPAFYYGRIIALSVSNRVIDQISPFNMRIEEPSEFAEARKLALRGDVDGAVKRYRAYLDNTDTALFEAARLLKSADRYAEAAALFLEISERFFGKKLVWAEATYHLAKLRESHLHQAKDAMALLNQILDRASDTRFGQLAQTELTRMQSLYTIDPNESVVYSEADSVEDPFFVEGQGTAPITRPAAPEDNGHRRAGDDTDMPAPAVDPFYAAALQRMKDDEEVAKPARKKAPVKSAAAPKAPVKKAPAKRKPKPNS